MASTSVNRPTDVKQKEQDINQKLQLYGIVTAFSNGKVPSNDQIDVALNTFKNKSFMTSPSKKLSPEGQSLVKEFRDVVEQAQHLLLVKNQGNLLQDFIWQTQQLDGGNASLPGAPVDKETAKQHGNQALEGLRTLGTLIVTNGQFRKLLSDASILLRDIAGDAAAKTASSISPSEEQLNQIDHPAEDNTWHEAPDLAKIKNQLTTKYKENTPFSKKDLKDAARDASSSAHPDGSTDPTEVARLAAQDQQQGTASGIDAASGVQAGISTLQDRASNNVDPEIKDGAVQIKEKAADAANAKKEQAKNYLAGKMPKERRDQTIWRLKKMVVEIQGHPDYQQAITTLLSLAEEYAGHANNVTQQSVGTVKGVREDNALRTAEADLKTLIERFANGTSTRDLFDSINAIYADADKDPELKNWFKAIDAYIRKCLQQQGYILEDASTQEYNQLYDQGNFLLRERYRKHTDRVLDEFKFLGEQFDKDPMNQKFSLACQKLFKSLGNDENGKPTFKPHLVKDLSNVILPAVFENIRYVPIPRIEFSDPMIDAVVENLVIESDNLMPNVVEFASDNYFRWGRKNNPNKNKNAIMISVSGIQMDLKDVAYYVKKKSGFPSVKDQGVFDLFLGGTGFSFKIKVSTADPSDRHHFFKVDTVNVDVKNFDIKLKQSSHKLIFGLFKGIMLKVMRPALQKVMEKIIREKFTEADKMAYSIKVEADRALKEVQDDPDNAPNVYNRYMTAAKTKFLEGKKKVDEGTADKKVNMAITSDDSIFPNVKLPGGISSKATQYKVLASKGNEWESPVFSIGSAAKTSNLPSAPEIVQRPHRTSPGGVTGPQNIGGTQSMTAQNRDISAQQATQVNGPVTNGNMTNGPMTNAPMTNGFSKQVDQAFQPNAAPMTY